MSIVDDRRVHSTVFEEIYKRGRERKPSHTPFIALHTLNHFEDCPEASVPDNFTRESIFYPREDHINLGSAAQLAS